MVFIALILGWTFPLSVWGVNLKAGSCFLHVRTRNSQLSAFPAKSRYGGAPSVRPSQMTCWLSPRNKYNLWLRVERLSIHPANPSGKHGVFSSDQSVGGRLQADFNTVGMKQPWGDVHILHLMGVFKRSICDEERPSHSLNNDQQCRIFRSAERLF